MDTVYISIVYDWILYLTSENITETKNDLAKVLSNTQAKRLSRKVNLLVLSNKVPDSIVVFQEQYLKGSFSLRLW